MKKFLKSLLKFAIGVAIFSVALAVVNLINAIMMNDYIDSLKPTLADRNLTFDDIVSGEVSFEVKMEVKMMPAIDENGVPYFTDDGDLKVMHLTDIHIGGGIFSRKFDKMALKAVADMVNAERPDLVIVTGDIAFAVPWSGTLNNSYAHKMFIRLMENLGIPWTIGLGNHDSKNYNFYNRAAVAKMYEDPSLTFCLFDSGSDDIYGECNHYIYIKNSQGMITRAFIIMDTNAYTDDDPLGLGWVYDNIHPDQIDWYREVIRQMNAYNDKNFGVLATKVKTMLFTHIPIMEMRDACLEYLEKGETEDVKYQGGNIGEEEPYVYSSEIEEEMFETMLEVGSTEAIFFGHDHLNNIVLNYKGITFSYGFSIDFFAYAGIAEKTEQRGCSLINWQADGEFEIIHENYYQDKYQSEAGK